MILNFENSGGFSCGLQINPNVEGLYGRRLESGEELATLI